MQEKDTSSWMSIMALDLVASSAEQYCHEPLPASDWIRLLILAPATNPTDPLMCSMTSTSLSKPCQYTALSYSWAMEDGDASLCRSLWVDGKHLRITRNLFEGLLRIRNTAQSLNLWIDAVCINQDDQLERNSQVAQMAQVYRSAEKVICWLGEGDDSASDQHAASILRRLAQCDGGMIHFGNEYVRAFLHGPKEGWCDGETVQNCSRCKELLHSMPRIQEQRDLEELYEKDACIRSRALVACRVICEFFDRRYWKRRWIVQEVVNSRQLSWAWGLQFFGDVQLTRDHIDSLWMMMTPIQVVHYLWVEIMLALRTLFLMRDTMYDWTEHPNGRDATLPESEVRLLVALQTLPAMECAIPLDRVYSLIGLSPEQRLVVPDYNRSMDQVCHEFAQALITLDLGDLILGHFEECPPPFFPQELPSWVPDLRGKFGGKWSEFEKSRFQATLGSDGRSLITNVYRLGSYGEDFTQKFPRADRSSWANWSSRADWSYLSFRLHDDTEVLVGGKSSNVKLTRGDIAYISTARLSGSWVIFLRPSDTVSDYRLLFARFAVFLANERWLRLHDSEAEKITLSDSRKETITII